MKPLYLQMEIAIKSNNLNRFKELLNNKSFTFEKILKIIQNNEEKITFKFIKELIVHQEYKNLFQSKTNIVTDLNYATYFWGYSSLNSLIDILSNQNIIKEIIMFFEKNDFYLDFEKISISLFKKGFYELSFQTLEKINFYHSTTEEDIKIIKTISNKKEEYYKLKNF